MDLEILRPAEWAGRLAGDLAVALAAPGQPRLLLPTGSTPRPVYEQVPARLAGPLNSSHVSDAGRATVVLLDEYLGLPTGDPARCDAQIRRDLIDRLHPAPRLISITPTPGAEEAAVMELDQQASRLDLAVLGLGLNGHVGMNEPGSTLDSPTRVVELQALTVRTAVEGYGATRAPDRGITVGLNRIYSAREIWLLVRGRGKAQILAEVLQSQVSQGLPASLLLDHPRLRVVADLDAASQLDRRAPHAPSHD